MTKPVWSHVLVIISFWLKQLKEENWLLKDEIKKCIEEVRKRENVQPVINIANVEVDPPEVTEQEKRPNKFQNEK